MQLRQAREWVSRRKNREPLQYIIGTWPFYEIELKLRAPVLIPRPETEVLVDKIIHSEFFEKAESFAEIGIGSGAISLSLLNLRNDLFCNACDVSKEACNLSRENAFSLGLEKQIEIFNLDFLNWKDYLFKESLKFDLLISNPPYIPSSEILTLQDEVRDFEDHRALDGGEAGYDLIEHIINVSSEILNPGATLWLETDSRHIELIKAQIDKINGLKLLETFSDLRGVCRFSCILKD